MPDPAGLSCFTLVSNHALALKPLEDKQAVHEAAVVVVVAVVAQALLAQE
jgi:hypothetical protein